MNKWKSEKGIKILGIPSFYGSGSHLYNKEKYRFIVIERYGKDLWSIFLDNKKKFPASVVFKCAIQIVSIFTINIGLSALGLSIRPIRKFSIPFIW